MVLIHNPFGFNPLEIHEEDSGKRVGRRIREIRTTRGWTQAELGEWVGLSADRVQKYENGIRKPKSDMLREFAKALGVETLALTDPIIDSYLGVVYALFAMEKQFDLRILEEDGQIHFVFGDGVSGDLNNLLKEWSKRYARAEKDLKAASTEEQRERILKDYKIWEWTFPECVISYNEDDVTKKKKELQKKIDNLQKELSKLDGDDQ